MKIDEIPKKRSAQPACYKSLEALQRPQSVYSGAERLWSPDQFARATGRGGRSGRPAEVRKVGELAGRGPAAEASSSTGGRPLVPGEYTLFGSTARRSAMARPTVAPAGAKVDFKVFNSKERLYSDRAGLGSWQTTQNSHVANVGTGGNPTVDSFFTGKLISH
mmetsp:Transcript_11669/g.37048  ORF Transcript_11669/g.37048 Transcript_11669/m.37048 type:complete len:163 (+) Transcript_11669:184-672(+)